MSEGFGEALIGRTVGNWELLRLLGEGAFGAVYEAQNTGIAGRRAAVKVLHPHLSVHTAIKQRFLNEASAASRAEHENIVQVFDGGITSDGICYSVMELLKGVTLSRAIAQGALGPRRAVNVGVQIASALEAAHALGIVHRDLKPDNVFLVERVSNAEFVKVLDFGVAKLRGDAASGGQLTKTGMMIGTPGYMSPEQWKALPDIDGRADIYALGCILFECLAGTLPFQGDNQYAWMMAHITAPVPDVRARVPSVTPELAALVGRMLAKEPGERPRSMVEVIEGLQAARATSGMHATAPPEAATLVPSVAAAGGAPVKQQSSLSLGAAEMKPREPSSQRPSTSMVQEGSRQRRVIGGVAALAIVGGAAFALLRPRAPAPTPPPAVENTQAAVVGAAKVTPPPAPAPAATVTVQFDSTPDGADVLRGGVVVGTTPLRLTLPSSKDPVVFTLHRNGFEDTAETVTPDQAMVVHVELHKKSAHPGRAPVADNHLRDPFGGGRDAPLRSPFAATEKAPSPRTPPAPTATDAADGEQLVNEAFSDFVGTKYASALEKARAALKTNLSDAARIKAWKVVGGSSCFLNDRASAVAAYNRLDMQGRQFLKYVCNKNGIDLQ